MWDLDNTAYQKCIMALKYFRVFVPTLNISVSFVDEGNDSMKEMCVSKIQNGMFRRHWKLYSRVYLIQLDDLGSYKDTTTPTLTHHDLSPQN